MAKFSENWKVAGSGDGDNSVKADKDPTEPIPVITPEDTKGVQPVAPAGGKEPAFAKFHHPAAPAGDGQAPRIKYPWNSDAGSPGDPGSPVQPPKVIDPIPLLVAIAAVCAVATVVLAGLSRNAADQPAAEDAVETAIVKADPEETGTYTIDHYFDVTSRNVTSYHIYYESPVEAAEGDGEDNEGGAAGAADGKTAQTETANITLDADHVTFEASGEDGTVTLYSAAFNSVVAETAETDEPEIVAEGVAAPEVSAVIHYDPDKRKVEEYGFVSLAKNGTAAATLTYSEAAGVTNTLSLKPSAVTVVDDGAGIVERIEEYDDNGQWITRWVAHSLS